MSVYSNLAKWFRTNYTIIGAYPQWAECTNDCFVFFRIFDFCSFINNLIGRISQPFSVASINNTKSIITDTYGRLMWPLCYWNFMQSNCLCTQMEKIDKKQQQLKNQPAK